MTFGPKYQNFVVINGFYTKEVALQKVQLLAKKQPCRLQIKYLAKYLPERPIWEGIQNGKWKGLLIFFTDFELWREVHLVRSRIFFFLDPSWQPKAIKGRKKMVQTSPYS